MVTLALHSAVDVAFAAIPRPVGSPRRADAAAMPTQWGEHRGRFVYVDALSPEMTWECDDDCPHPSHEEQP